MTQPPPAARPPRPGKPTLFISYAHADTESVDTLRVDLALECETIWFDGDIIGGQEWWDTILEHLRDADIVMYVLSSAWERSAACRKERTYATQLGKLILPVKVGDVDYQLATDSVQRTQVVDYRRRTHEAVHALTKAVREIFKNGPAPLRTPPDGPPPAPTNELEPLRERLTNPQLDTAEQQGILADLRAQAKVADPRAVLEVAIEFLARGDELIGGVRKALEALVRELQGDRSIDQLDQLRAGVRQRNLSDLDPDMVAHLTTIVNQIGDGSPDKPGLTPIIGRGMTDSLLGPMGLLAREWAAEYSWPGGLQRSNDLPLAAQFVKVVNGSKTLENALNKGLRSHLVQMHEDAVDNEPDGDLARLLRTAWERQRNRTEHDPHMALAALPCRVYVTAHPWDLMKAALEATPTVDKQGNVVVDEQGNVVTKQPVVELCRWKPEDAKRDNWKPSVFDANPGWRPTVEQPLVFHVFGMIDNVDSLVLSADDYLDFLMNVSRNPDIIPAAVRAVLADSALLLLGFGMDETDVRVLLRTLISQEGVRRGNDHVGAQARRSARAEGQEKMYHRYVEKYFRGKRLDPAIDIFWGTVDEFASGLAELWSQQR